MESQNIEFSAVIKFLTKEGAKAKESHWRMADVYGDSSPKYSTVAKWSAEFKHRWDSLEDDPRPGRPADVMIDRVERLVLNNRRIKVAELASECGISNGSVYTIIHEHLGMSKVSTRWVPRNLNMQDCQQRVASRVAQAAIRECKFQQLNHPPYSPDLAPSDYYMFWNLKPSCVERDFGTMMSSRLLQRLGLRTKMTTFISKA